MPTIHVFDFLDNASPDRLPAVCVIFGGEPFLRHEALRHIRDPMTRDSRDASYETVDGQCAEWRDVRDEVSTFSLFGAGSRRLVVVDDADDFVSKNRTSLEAYVERPKAAGILVLNVASWLATTRLYKAVDASGLQVDCRPPEKQAGRRKTPDDGRMTQWLVTSCGRRHDAKLETAAARELMELVGPQFGILDQELAKLALFAGAGGKITAAMVSDIVGGWRTKTIWELIDAALDGNAAEAIRQLDLMFRAGEYPLALFGPMAGSMRRFAAATRAFQRAESIGRPISLREALVQGGMPNWPQALEKAERQLKQLGRHRAAKLYRWLLETDLALKGSHSSPDRARFAIERLILRISQHAARAAPAELKVSR